MLHHLRLQDGDVPQTVLVDIWRWHEAPSMKWILAEGAYARAPRSLRHAIPPNYRYFEVVSVPHEGIIANGFCDPDISEENKEHMFDLCRLLCTTKGD